MTTDEFSKIINAANKEAACHYVFDKATDIWELGDPATLTESQITVICVETFFGEVCNGGIVQYLDNISGEWAFRCSDALQSVGLPDYADIFRRALCLHHPSPVPTERSAWLTELEVLRNVHLSECFDDDYRPYDQEFLCLYLPNPTEFRDKLYAYIVQHERDFIQN